MVESGSWLSTVAPVVLRVKTFLKVCLDPKDTLGVGLSSRQQEESAWQRCFRMRRPGCGSG